MLNFSYENKTKIHFGQGQIAKLTREIPKSARVLVIYGGGSIKKNGIYQQVSDALKNHTWQEFSGIEPNPSYETAMRAVAVIKEHNLDYILAVGGGSVIDGSKFIAAAACFEGDPWQILAAQGKISQALPLSVVLTLPATGSESNSFAVISSNKHQEKRAFGSPLVQPLCAILDPTVSFSLPDRQVSNGIVDAFVHVVEQYLTFDVNAPVQDRFAEGILATLIEQGSLVFEKPDDVAIRANIMWAATMALNGLIGVGVPQDWSTHGIGHQLTILYGLDHAQTLAIVLPRLLWQMRDSKQAKLLQFAERVWHIEQGSDEQKIKLAIEKTEAFFNAVKMKTRLSDYGLNEEVIEPVIAKLTQLDMTKMGENQLVTLDVVRKVLQDSV